MRIIFTLPNSDTGGRVIIPMIHDFVERHTDRSIAFTSLGQIRYLSALQYITAVVGNSSSGILEVPSFGKPTLNIGRRQKGRLCADSVVHCGTSEAEISEGLDTVLSDECIRHAATTINPYEKHDTASEILRVLKTYPLSGIVRKTFYNL